MRIGKSSTEESIVSSGKLVEIDYTITADSGEILDTTNDTSPFRYVHGGNKLFSGLQLALEGKSPGETSKVTLNPEQAYGEYDSDKTMNIESPLLEMTSDGLAPGLQFEAPTEDGVRLVTILSVDGYEVIVDLNHPLAGKTLHIEATVNGIRDAEFEELEQEKVST